MAEHDDKPIRQKPKIGLALGSGLARGWAHIGVIKALKKHGIEPDIVAGTSIGALVGGAYACGKLDELEEWARSLTRMKVMGYLDLRVRSGGLIGGKKLYKLMHERFGDVRMEDLDIPFTAVATDMVTGHEVWLRRGKMIDVMRASFSLPGVFPPVRRHNRWLVDGALVNPVPLSVCQAMGSSMTIAVNLNADIIGKARHRGEKIPTVAGFDPLDDASGVAGIARKIPVARRLFKRDADGPSLFGVMVSSLNIVQDRLARSRLAGEPPDINLVPRIGHIGLMEFERVGDLIEAGEIAVERMLPEIQDAYQVLCVDRFHDIDERSYQD